MSKYSKEMLADYEDERAEVAATIQLMEGRLEMYKARLREIDEEVAEIKVNSGSTRT